MIYRPGDPVWARNTGGIEAPLGEHAAVVVGVAPSWEQFRVDGDTVYLLVVEGYQPPPNAYGVCCNSRRMRPRRDDYQQYEGLGSWDECKNPSKVLEPA